MNLVRRLPVGGVPCARAAVGVDRLPTRLANRLRTRTGLRLAT